MRSVSVRLLTMAFTDHLITGEMTSVSMRSFSADLLKSNVSTRTALRILDKICT